MPAVDEASVFNALSTYRLSGTAIMGGHEIRVSIEPYDNHANDSPDFILFVEISFSLFGQPVKVRVPVPVEAEKGGIFGGAVDDLNKLIDRRHHKVQMPMLVVAECGYDEQHLERDLPADVTVVQIPVRTIADVS